VVVIAFVVMLFCNRYTRKKIYDANAASVELIKKTLGGAKEFDDMLERQKNYMDSYYDSLYPDDEDEFEEEDSEELPAPQPEEVEVVEDSAVEETKEVEEAEADKNE
ncbi:MAG: hypothetical protein K2O22_05450, partial [Anaeroplasmataceae bacterium]|nr:hypothetical protein [Anaeroplasmataceae bacterium]